MKRLSKAIYHYLTIFLALIISSCNSGKSDLKAVKEENFNKTQTNDKPAEVVTSTLEYTDFMHELVSNGKITSKHIAEVKFHTSEIISEIYVKNGDYVTKGQRIATLDTYSLRNKLEEARDALDRSTLDMQDILIGQGYRLDNLDSVPEDLLRLAKVKSGYNNKQTQFNIAENELKKATIIAPISGTVANLFANTQTLSNTTDVFCNIIDTRSLEVSFTVLESELGIINKGDKVKIHPFAIPDIEVTGRVSEINPWVNENGMVQVRATVEYHPKLVEGMNVRISAYRSAGKMLVVPKSAVVLRTNKKVVFSVVNGKAFWNYVETGYENADQYSITSETLKEGDQIIISGNINLAHDSRVKVINTSTK